MLVSAAGSVAADDLDAALEARKKKANRRVYSERVLMDDQNLLVPKTPTEEERALDRELEQLERQLDNQFVPRSEMTGRRPVAPAPVKPENWLTPALLDTEADDGLPTGKTESDWIREELERRKELQQHKEALAKEEAQVNKMLQEDSRQPFATGSSPLKSYETKLHDTLTPAIGRTAPHPVVLDPLGSLRPKEKTDLSGRGTRFSPAARSDSGVIKPAFSSSPSPSASSTPRRSPQLGPPSSRTVSKPSWDWNKSRTEPLPPLERVRRSSPIYRKDPFEDDFMPDIKTSIWD